MSEILFIVVGILLLMFLAYRAGWDDGKWQERADQNFAKLDRIMADIGAERRKPGDD